MSGIFMDGGGHDHIGHGVQPGHGGGDGFLDGGHDHGSHAMHGHGGHGGDGGGFINHLLGYNQQTGHHSFLSHLLGLDHDAHGGQGGHGTPTGHAPSQTPIWNSAMQAMKLSHAVDGIKITTNAWFLIMFSCFIGWLFVLYWIRHHEPFANAVVGTGAARSATLAADRRMIDNCRDAIPFRTAPDGQQLFTPMPQQYAPSPPAQQSAPYAQTATPTLVQMSSAQLAQAQGGLPISLNTPAAPLPIYNLGPYADNGIYTPQATGPIVNVPTPAAGGPRLKTIVNR